MNARTQPRPAVGPNVPDVRHGTAEQLARISHFRAVEQHQPEELDFLALWVIGCGIPAADKWDLWAQIRPLAEHLWSFVADDWDEDDCDAMTVDEAEMPAGHAEEACADRTRSRLVRDIEQQVWLARYRAAEARRAVTA